MRTTYRTLAYLVAAEVVLQAAFIAWAVFGLSHWIDGGGTLDKQVMNDTSTWHFTEERGFMFHGINGQMLIPLLSLALLVVAFIWRAPGVVRNAAILFGLVVLQVVLGMAGEDVPFLGALHGLNALLVFGAAVMAAKLAGTAHQEVAPPPDQQPAANA